MRWPPGNGQGPDSQSPAANEVMTPEMRLRQLQARHRALDNRISEMQEFPYQNHILLQRLKKEKLRLKDCIALLKDEIIPDLDA
ncbi:MAG: YdcH family protein [Chromatocurvus sp.]